MVLTLRQVRRGIVFEKCASTLLKSATVATGLFVSPSRRHQVIPRAARAGSDQPINCAVAASQLCSRHCPGTSPTRMAPDERVVQVAELCAGGAMVTVLRGRIRSSSPPWVRTRGFPSASQYSVRSLMRHAKRLSGRDEDGRQLKGAVDRHLAPSAHERPSGRSCPHSDANQRRPSAA